MTTELMGLESHKKNMCKLERWTRKDKNLVIDIYLDIDSYQMIINDGTFVLSFEQYVNLCQVLKKNGFNWSTPL